MIATGERLPEATLQRLGPNGPEKFPLKERLAGKKTVIFALPGAFTPTCDSSHVPSFIRTAEAFRQRGVDDIICISVNDVYVMKLWGETTGATAAGILMLSDGDAAYTSAVGMAFSSPAVGFVNRSRRYAMVVDDGVVTTLHLDPPGQCSLSTGESLLEEV